MHVIRPALAVLCLLLCSLMPPSARAADAAPALVAGRDYVVIDDGTPWRPLDGKIEVVEVFAYWCSHCAEFQPALSAWVALLPEDVRFTYLPSVFDFGDNFARAWFAAEQAGAVQRTHAAMYNAVHTDRVLAHNATIGELAWFYGQHGLDAAAMKAAMAGPEVEAQLKAAHAFELRSGVTGTPTLIVNGRYRITPRSHADAFRIADQLIAKLRAAR